MNYANIPEETAKRIFKYLTESPKSEPQFIADVSGLAVAIANAKPLPRRPGPKPRIEDKNPDAVVKEADA